MTCPDENSIARLLDGALPAVERASVESHLDTCASCSALVAELACLIAPGERANAMFACDRCGERYTAAGTCARDGGVIRSASDPLIGQNIGSYRVLRLIGEGGMGRVYAAVQRELGSRVALKVIGAQYADDTELAKRFLTEARAVNMIRHDGIVKTIDLLRTDDGRPVIVMELIDGHTLRQIERAGVVPIGGAVQVMLDVLSALGAAHAIGIIHRDLKPDNILIDDRGRAKVLDFGIAKILRLPAGYSIARTRTGVLLGTPEYMAPEQIVGDNPDVRSDIYAAGVVLFEAIGGRRPFVGATDFAIMRAHIETPPPSLRALRPELPPKLEEIILSALAKRPADRFANATAMARALYEASATLSADQWRTLAPSTRLLPANDEISDDIAATNDERSARSRSRTNVRRVAAVAGALAVGAMIGGAVLSHRASGDDRVITTVEPPRLFTPVVPADATRTTPTPTTPTPPTMPTTVTTSTPSPHGGRASKRDSADRFEVALVGTRIDPGAYLATARALARRLEPDAEIEEMSFAPVAASGVMEPRAQDAEDETSWQYEFVSPARGAALSATGSWWCAIHVAIDSVGRAATVERAQRTACPELPRKVPRCTAAQLWAKASAKGFESKVAARISWDTNQGVWLFAGHRGNESTYVALVDDCTPGATVANVAPVLDPSHAPVETTGGPFDDDKPAPVRPPAPTPRDPPDGTFFTRFDPATFEPIAFIPSARALARQLESDAELIEIDFTARPDGTVESGGTYRFRSAHRGMPEQPPQNYQCMVDVHVNTHGSVTTSRTYDQWCTNAVVGVPRCTFKQIWAKASSKRAEPSPSRLRWDADQWVFDGVVDGNYQSFRFRDDCT